MSSQSSGWSEKFLLINVRRISLSAIVLLCLLLCINLVIAVGLESRMPTLGTYRLAVVSAILGLAYFGSYRWGHRISGGLAMLAFYLGFIAYPLLPYYRDLEEDIFLILFLSIATSIMPYLMFRLNRDRYWIIAWIVLTLGTSVAAFANTLSALRLDAEFNQLPKVLESQPMLPFAYLACLVLLQLTAVYFKRTMEAQRSTLMARNEELETQRVEIMSQHEALNELNSSKDRVFSIIAHDLRSPLNSLQSILALFQADQNLPPEQLKEIMGKVGVRVQGLSILLNNLLYWAMEEMDSTVSMKPRFLNLYPFVQEIRSMFFAVAEDKNVEIITKVPQDLPPLFADADALRLVLRNLVANAIKYSYAGGEVTITVEHLPGALKICITDQGVGMSEKQTKSLSDQALAASTLGTKNEKGTGLGLMITQQFLAKNQGTFGVESEEGKGTRFWFTLPLAAPGEVVNSQASTSQKLSPNPLGAIAS